MALRSVLVDRARPIIKAAASARVEGTTQMSEHPGAEFRCRLFLPGGSQSVAPSPPGGYGRVKDIKRPTLMWDKHGPSLEFDQRVEVRSEDFGDAVWQIEGSPEVIRRRSAGSKLGYQATLQRISEGTFEEL